MWARVCEIMFGLWLLISPFVFRYGAGDTRWWISDYVSAALVLVLAFASFWRPAKHAHLGILVVSAWLFGFGYLASGDPPPPAAQNHLLVGILLAMLAIIPSDTFHPPAAWRRHYERGGT